jgi:hypothetical protein
MRTTDLPTKTIKATPGDAETIAYLVKTYKWDRDLAVRVLSIAITFGIKAQPTEGGYALVRRVEANYIIEDHAGRATS